MAWMPAETGPEGGGGRMKGSRQSITRVAVEGERGIRYRALRNPRKLVREKESFKITKQNKRSDNPVLTTEDSLNTRQG